MTCKGCRYQKRPSIVPQVTCYWLTRSLTWDVQQESIWEVERWLLRREGVCPVREARDDA